MNFNSQICATKEQSERLLALGLKKETADIVIRPDNTLMVINENSFIYHNLEKAIQEGYFPAWSLHRLIEMADTYIEFSPFTGVNFQDGPFSTNRDNDYDAIVDIIEWLIQKKHFNKEYLEE